MVAWTSLAEVEDFRAAGKTVTFDPSLVWLVNYDAPNPYPRKFTYSSCPFRYKSGRVCGKSLEFSPKCDHDLPASVSFRFHVQMIDAIYGGISPISAQVWDVGNSLFECSAVEFAERDELQQIDYAHSILHKSPRAKVRLSASNYEVKLLGITFMPEARPLRSPSTPLRQPEYGVGSSQSSTPKVSKSSSKGKSKTRAKPLAEAIEELVRSFKSHGSDIVDGDSDSN
ncbi:unnamed protein product [Calypogeia fissa]